ncbi:MAG: hypothetical protein KA965_03245 [Butyrivibrio sp.]|nr:hypothetical protein [Butyrivibrio sp.]
MANNGYVCLNMNLINSKESKIVSSKEALKDVTTINWSDKVLSGEKKVLVSDKKMVGES